jgi:opacity protein-like surface antigen
MTAVAPGMAAAVAALMAATVATAAAAAAAAEDKGRSLVLTAHQGDSNQREKHRETKNNNTVHPRILQLLTGTVSGKYQVAV